MDEYKKRTVRMVTGRQRQPNMVHGCSDQSNIDTSSEARMDENCGNRTGTRAAQEAAVRMVFFRLGAFVPDGYLAGSREVGIS
eukprot:scaffold9345_cov120-Cylindrotheca_fusiformis.AAC.12